MIVALPLFPDLLDQCQYGQHNDFVRRGHGVWLLYWAKRNRKRHDGWRDSMSLCVVFDDERYHVHKTGKHWNVTVNHDLTKWEEVSKGWGNSKKTERRLRCRRKRRSRQFANREEAIELAERLISLITQREQRLERDQE